MKSYILRIYRDCDAGSRGLVGVLEEAGVEGSRVFTNVDELWELLRPPRTTRRTPRRRRQSAEDPVPAKEKAEEEGEYR